MKLREVLGKGLGKVYTGFSYSVLSKDGVIESGSGGETGSGEPVDEFTLFDLASLTKPIVTATLAGQLVSEGRVGLWDPIRKFLPEFGVEDKAGVTLGSLLNHTSGMEAWLPLYKWARNVDEALAIVARTPLAYPTGTREVYSDLGYITAGRAIEVVLGNTLDAAARERVFSPLGMRDTGYRPDPSRHVIALTEKFEWRPWGPGLVHDENCFYLGGITGHAGLFSNLRDLEKFVLGLLRRSPVFPERAISMFLDRSNVAIGGEHSFGWFIKVSDRSTFGSRCSYRTIGHTGFTGTGMWIDFEGERGSILLTNRVFYGRDPAGIQAIRREFNEIAFSTRE